MGSSTLNFMFVTKLITSFGVMSPCVVLLRRIPRLLFLSEMVNLAKDNPHPILIGGFQSPSIPIREK
jgi:hypothetical protein